MPTSVIGLRSSGSITLDSADRTADFRASASWSGCGDITRECRRSRQLTGPGTGAAGINGAGASTGGATIGAGGGGGGAKKNGGGNCGDCVSASGAGAAWGVRQKTWQFC